MHPSIQRRTVALAAAALAACAVPFFTTGAPAQADTTIDTSLDYSCDLLADLSGTPDGNLETLGTIYQVGVQVRFTAPNLVRGGVVPPTPVAVRLAMPADLHQTSVELLQGRYVTGSSTDTQLEVRGGGSKEQYLVGGLSVTEQPIEQDLKKPWNIDIDGTAPEIAVPDAASADLLAPQAFTVSAAILDDQKNFFIRVQLNCTAPKDRALATLAVAGSDPTDDPTTTPTDDPTDDPTTSPTDDPTTSPTDGPTTSPTVGGGGASGNGASQASGGGAAATDDALPNTGAPGRLALVALVGVALFVVGASLTARRPTRARR